MLRTKWGIIASLSVLIIVIIAAFITFQQLNKPDKVVKIFEEAIQQNKPDQLKEIILPDHEEAVVNNGTLSSLVQFLKSNDHSYQTIKDGLHEQMETKNYSPTNQQISLVADGKKWGVITNYKLRVKTASIKVTGKNEEDQIKLSAKSLKEPLKKNEEELYGPILPGTYEVTLTLNNALGTLTENKKTDVWGNDVVSFVVDPENLVKNDKKINNDIVEALDILNRDFSTFETSSFNTEVFTNADDYFKGDEYTQALIDDEFSSVVDYIDEIHSQYLGTIVNLDQLNIEYFDGQWSATVPALVSYNRKIKIANLPDFEDISYKSVRHYALVYDNKAKKWLIHDLMDYEADGTEHEDWEKKKNIEVKNPPLLKWTRTDSGSQLTSL